MNDQDYMRTAIELAQNGAGWVNPNPLVGAVVVKNDQVIGRGWHTKFGALHAEREALASCVESPKGSTVYVTLEPCCHWGKTPPCTQALIEAEVSRVVVGSPDPNPLVAGKGIAQLKEAGISVTEGVLEEECNGVNRVFFHYIQAKTPYVIAKYAMTLDGKIATKTGASKWITSEKARKRVHLDRQRYSAIMVGINTVLTDNPQLTCRLEGKEVKNPLRVVLDSHLRITPDLQIPRTAHEAPTLIATCCNDEKKIEQLKACGCDVEILPEKEGSVDLSALMQCLGTKGIDSVMVEGGATLLWSLFSDHLVNRVQAYIAPKVFGGKTAPSPVSGEGVELPSQAFLFTKPSVEVLGDDILLECEVK